MKILTISDEECPALWDYYVPGRLADYQLILSCGDLKSNYLSFLVTMARCPVLYVHGNHDAHYSQNPPEGCDCIDDRIVVYNGLRILGLGGCGALALINLYMVRQSARRMDSLNGFADTRADCILVLGARVWEDGRLSQVLKDRVDAAIALYKEGCAPKLLMSGDHSRIDYDEVTAMKTYAVAHGAASSDVFLDHAGFSTYESVYRARDVFQAERVIIVTQGYHLYRALYIADRLGLEAYGVASDARSYARQPLYTLREIVARCKDFFYTVAEPEPTYLGRVIPVSGDGDATNSSTPRPIQ